MDGFTKPRGTDVGGQRVEGAQVGRVAVREATLEDAYVRLVGRVE
jgi:hypothetical protein